MTPAEQYRGVPKLDLPVRDDNRVLIEVGTRIDGGGVVTGFAEADMDSGGVYVEYPREDGEPGTEIVRYELSGMRHAWHKDGWLELFEVEACRHEHVDVKEVLHGDVTVRLVAVCEDCGEQLPEPEADDA